MVYPYSASLHFRSDSIGMLGVDGKWTRIKLIVFASKAQRATLNIGPNTRRHAFSGVQGVKRNDRAKTRSQFDKRSEAF